MNIQVDCSGSSYCEFSFKKKSGHSQDDLVCRRLSIIFMDQGNISKLHHHPQTCFLTNMDSQCNLCNNILWMETQPFHLLYKRAATVIDYDEKNRKVIFVL